MAADWKPGDVAMVNDTTYPDAPWKVAMCTASAQPGVCETRWRIDTGEVWSSVSEARPLVVIDPESREQVDKFTKALVEAMYAHGKHGHAANGIHPDDVTDALREFANPTPPKPEEPTGLGAVVEDAEGHEWTRWSRGVWPNRAPWRSDTAKPDHRDYRAIAAVRVLSEGVQS